MPGVFANLFRLNRYVSTRVHGTSAQVEINVVPNDWDKDFKVKRAPHGTIIKSNYPVSVYLSIPAPLIVDRGFVLNLFGRTSVFKDSTVRVRRVGLFYKISEGVHLTTLRVMDGDVPLGQWNMGGVVLLQDDEFYEGKTSYYVDIDEPISKGLGVSFDAWFREDALYPNELQVIGARAVFSS